VCCKGRKRRGDSLHAGRCEPEKKGKVNAIYTELEYVLTEWLKSWRIPEQSEEEKELSSPEGGGPGKRMSKKA